MLHIVADNKIPFLKGVLEPYARVEYFPGSKITRDVIKGADALLIRTRTKCTPELLEGTSVKFIGSATIGFDHIDTDFCEKNGIRWTNAPGCNSFSVQQYVMAALLKIASEFRFNLKDKTIGIIGVGNVGTKVEKFARAMSMNVLLNDPPRQRREGKNDFSDFDVVITESDIITMHVPLTLKGEDATYHIIDEKSIGKMKKGAWFINSSRGEVADTDALKKALYSAKLAGAVFDVWEHEPDIDIELMNRAFIATPHIAGYSADGKANGTAMVVNALTGFFKLPVENWFPDDIPLPLSPLIAINAKGKSEMEIVSEAVCHTYNISEDDRRFRLAPSDFEKLRDDYPVRREPPAYTVKLQNSCENVLEILKQLRFRIEQY
ncbi:MAG: 4-phosphoerythronate dehydrogenase PdxB [Bacteroidales bacterium]|nr:4-phosphoerythronate dehydrogenase PdxB [Bacteroidales bacterium]